MARDAFQQELPRRPKFTDMLFQYHPHSAESKESYPACTPIINIYDTNNNEKIRPTSDKSAEATKSKGAETVSNIRPRQLSKIFQLPSGSFLSKERLAELNRVKRTVDYFTTFGQQSRTKEYLQLLKEKILDPLYRKLDQLNAIHYPNKKQQKYLTEYTIFLDSIESYIKKIFIAHFHETDDILLTTIHEILSKFLHAYKYSISNINIDFIALVESLKADFFKRLRSENFLDIEEAIFKNAQEELNLQIKREKYIQHSLKKRKKKEPLEQTGKEKKILEAEQTLEKTRNLEKQRDTVPELMQTLTYGDLSEILRDTTHNLQMPGKQENQHAQASRRYASWKLQLLGGIASLILSAALFVVGGLVMGSNPGAGGAALVIGVYFFTAGIGLLHHSRENRALCTTQAPEQTIQERTILTATP